MQHKHKKLPVLFDLVVFFCEGKLVCIEELKIKLHLDVRAYTNVKTQVFLWDYLN